MRALRVDICHSIQRFISLSCNQSTLNHFRITYINIKYVSIIQSKWDLKTRKLPNHYELRTRALLFGGVYEMSNINFDQLMLFAIAHLLVVLFPIKCSPFMTITHNVSLWMEWHHERRFIRHKTRITTLLPPKCDADLVARLYAW